MFDSKIALIVGGGIGGFVTALKNTSRGFNETMPEGVKSNTASSVIKR